ncbi:hypothetical protein [Rhizomonospora bruguierae]|uniref:hypothetical protein n=1 Tax=Rhizomonospora bruguierae TaxID=1581705 RepID=UPI001BCFF684|nr:hypothetical protein [Micromonospora sp. NBRC 107566]
MFATGLAVGAELVAGLTRAALASTARFADALAAVPPLAAPNPGGTIDTSGAVSFIASKVAPILLAVLGIIFIGRASKGEVSKVLTSSAIAIIGLAFIAGAATLFFVGEALVNILFK